MGAYELLESLLEQLAADFPQGEFRAAYGAEQGSRRVERLTVAGQVAKERFAPEGWSGKLELTVFLPRGTGPGEAEPLLAAVEAAARELAPGFRGMERGKAQQDKPTGLLAIPCAVEFAGLDEGVGGEVTLGGKTYPVAGWSVAVSTEGRELVSIGESQAFAPGGPAHPVHRGAGGPGHPGPGAIGQLYGKAGGVAGDVCGLPVEEPLPKPGGVRLLPAAGGDSITKDRRNGHGRQGTGPGALPGAGAGQQALSRGILGGSHEFDGHAVS